MSLISLSRRELLARTIATGVGGLFLSSFGSRPAPAQSLTLAEDLRKGVVSWNKQVAHQPPLIQDWLGHSEIIRATKNEFADDSFHGEWANDYAYEHEEKKYVRGGTIFGAESNSWWMGIVYHPWQHIDGYHPFRTLNVVEKAAQYENRTFFERTLSFYQEGQMTFAPFPDTKRLRLTQVHYDSFYQIVRKANLNPDDYRLHYARYHVMAGRAGGSIRPRPLIAHAYTLKTAVNVRQELRMTYSSAT
jgi:hypothetical protein